MIKFFRRIRQKLIVERNLRKYLIYAIGEILLVVIGILIALQINNRNERSKVYKIEQEYLKRLKTDLEKDKIYFTERRQYADELLKQYQIYTDKSYDFQETYKNFSELFCCLDFPPTELSIHKSTYTELISTGNLSTIQSGDLREDIGNHYEIFEKHNRHLIEFDSYANIVLGNNDAKVLMSKHMISLRENLPKYEYHMLDNDSWFFINKPNSVEFRSLENTVGTYHHKFKTFLSYLSDVENNTNELLEKIEKELQ